MSLSHETVARRVAELRDNVMLQLKKVLLMKPVDKNFTFCKEQLIISLLHGATKGIDIYSNLIAIIDAYEGLQKCACIVTDGARSITGEGMSY